MQKYKCHVISPQDAIKFLPHSPRLGLMLFTMGTDEDQTSVGALFQMWLLSIY